MSLIPKEYFDSRDRFRNLANAAGGRLSAFPVASALPVNSNLTVDSVFLGNEEANNVVVMVSGVHGIEGYAGSACIQHFLREYKAHFQDDRISYLAVHALNPWGFANDCRVTEENIDLNRNFVNFAKPLPSSIHYSRFYSILCEDYKPGLNGFFNEIRLFFAILGAKGRRAFQEAVTAGQYQYRSGLFYGGSQATQNRKIWERIMQEYLRPEQNIRFLDIHTGLGKKGHGALLTHLPVSSSKFQSLNSWLDQQVTSTTQDTNISAFISGPLPAFVEDSLGQNCYTVALEFGVAGPLYTLNALQADNWLRTTRDKKAAVLRKAAIKSQMRKAFIVDDSEWERKIVSRFEWTMGRLVQSLGAH